MRPPTLRIKPMPALFPGAEADRAAAGTRGVLHKQWAAARLAELDAEIAAEMRANGESVGLEMALQEKVWITEHFGLDAEEAFPEGLPAAAGSMAPPTSVSPRSPLGGKLGEKLRGLKLLATSPAGLAVAAQGKSIFAT